MGETKVIELTDEQREKLENGYRNGNSHGFRARSQMVLLKSEKRTSVAMTEILGGRGNGGQQLAQTLRAGRHQRLGNSAGTWT